MKLSERDQYENILLLCPTCHSIVDKNPSQYPVDLLVKWKAEHKEKIKSVFKVPKFTSRSELRKEMVRLLRRNSSIFDSYGPHSPNSVNPLSDAVTMWKELIKSEIIPNNRSLVELFLANDDLLNNGERVIVDKFSIHKIAFEYNHLTGDKNSSAPLFPSEINNILED